MKTKLLVPSIAAALALVGVAKADLVESFNDWKGYNGAYCKSANNSVDVRSSVSGISNWHTAATTVYCPVVRDIAEGGPNRVSAAVRLFNNNQRTGGSCTLISRNINNRTTVDFDRETWPAGYQDHTIRLGPVDANNWGSYMVYCTLPAREGARKSFIRSVSVDEQL